MSKTVHRFIVISIFCLGCLNVQAQQNDYLSAVREKKLSEESRTAVQERMETVRKELETLKDHPWAGSYFRNGMLGPNLLLTIAPKSGFAYTWHSGDILETRKVNGKTVIEYSLGDQNYGDVTWEDGCLKLSPVLSVATSLGPLSTEFFPITWDKRVYLVPTNKIIDFCNNVNRVYPEYLNGSFFFSRSLQEIEILQPYTERPKPTGKPDVPEKFKPYLLEKPVEGEVIAIGETREVRKRMYGSMEMNVIETVVTINRGSRDGLLPDMEFCKTQKNEQSARLFVIPLTNVSETESEGIVVRHINESPPQIGWSVSTKAMW